ncbi:MAG: ATP-binding protein [Sphaerochaetaceae bacterium]|nr:histidine kinase [Spirochaetales bacterium]
MNNFVRRAFEKIEKLSIDEIKTLVGYQASENELLGKVFDTLDIGILVVSESGRVLACNTSTKRLLPVSRTMAEGSSIKYVVNDADLLHFFNTMITSTEPISEPSIEFHFQRGDVVRTLEISHDSFVSAVDSIFQHDTGKRHVFFINDISENKRQEARLHRSESLASLTTVAAGVAHEIKNPLASIGIHLQLLRKAFQRKKKLSIDDAKRYLDIIDEEIERLNSIVVDFLFAVRPMDVHLRLENINRIIDDLCSFVEPELNSQHITLKRQLAQFLPKVLVDENLIKQALLNIVKNAMNAMEVNGGLLSVTTKLQQDQISISCSDTGTGMSEQTLSKIFEPYFTTKPTGSGLGLTMVFKVIKEHHGEINVTSQLGEGTTFTILLPVPKSERMAIEDKGEAYETDDTGS